jgi:hypothetical protein
MTTPPETFTALKARIADTLAALEGIQPAEVDAFAGRGFTMCTERLTLICSYVDQAAGRSCSWKPPSNCYHWLLLGLVFGTLALPTGLPASSTPAAISDSARTASGAVAPELSYTVISSDRDKISKTLKVRLSRTATEAELSQLAVRLKTEQQGAAARFSVWFFLSDTQLGSHDPAWATANFEPELRIDIHGLTQDQLAQATASAEKVPKPLGRWIWNYAAGSGPVVIAKVGGRFVLTQQYKDGSTRKLTLKESKSTRGRLFTDVKGSDFGEYFLLLPDGGLEIGDKDGAIGTATRLKGARQKEDIQ